jgi:signal transduction histidine kinase
VTPALALLSSAESATLRETALLRQDSVRVRILNAILICTIGIGLTQRIDLSLAWLTATATMQGLDWLACRRLSARADSGLVQADKLAFAGWTFVTVSVFASAGVLYWVFGGLAGKITAILLLCAGLLHVSVTTYTARSVMVASITPYLIILCGLTLIHAPLSGVYGWPETIAAAAALIGFFSNFRKGADLLNATLSKLRGALVEADDQRATAEARRREADEANDAKSRFLANMSHELRTPLNAIIGFNELLAESAVEDGRAADVKDHQRVNAAAERLLRLINELLDITKIESGRMLFDLRDYDPAEIARDAADTVRPLVEANGNRFELEIAPDLGRGHADPFRISQGVINLLSNAAKFTKGGLVRLQVRRDNDVIAFIVSDTGCGIPADRIGHLFQPFAQADATVAHSHGGTGLGLALTRRIARALGGDAWATSETGKGSVFTMTVAAGVRQPIMTMAA